MKKILIFILPLVFAGCALGGLNKLKTINEGPLLVEAFNGTASFLWVGEDEITNRQYQVFLADLKSKGKDITAFLPDTACFSRMSESIGKNLDGYYFTHPAYDQYPVVGISRAGAQAYCFWLTETLRKAGGRYANISFRLPTEQEWFEFMAISDSVTRGSIIQQGNMNKGKIRKTILANLKWGNGDFISKDGLLWTAPKKVFSAGRTELKAVYGNAAEMVEPAGQAGGSWFNTPDQLNKLTSFPEPDARVGFRVVASVGDRN
jgi:hypothetical protein